MDKHNHTNITENTNYVTVVSTTQGYLLADSLSNRADKQGLQIDRYDLPFSTLLSGHCLEILT